MPQEEVNAIKQKQRQAQQAASGKPNIQSDLIILDKPRKKRFWEEPDQNQKQYQLPFYQHLDKDILYQIMDYAKEQKIWKSNLRLRTTIDIPDQEEEDKENNAEIEKLRCAFEHNSEFFANRFKQYPKKQKYNQIIIREDDNEDRDYDLDEVGVSPEERKRQNVTKFRQWLLNKNQQKIANRKLTREELEILYQPQPLIPLPEIKKLKEQQDDMKVKHNGKSEWFKIKQDVVNNAMKERKRSMYRCNTAIKGGFQSYAVPFAYWDKYTDPMEKAGLDMGVPQKLNENKKKTIELIKKHKLKAIQKGSLRKMLANKHRYHYEDLILFKKQMTKLLNNQVEKITSKRVNYNGFTEYLCKFKRGLVQYQWVLKQCLAQKYKDMIIKFENDKYLELPNEQTPDPEFMDIEQSFDQFGQEQDSDYQPVITLYSDGCSNNSDQE